MLLTISQPYFDHNTAEILCQLKDDDGVLFWQDGILAIAYYHKYLTHLNNKWALDIDVKARAICVDIPKISLEQAVIISAQFTPQLAL